jgi:hypothetical protein
MQSSTLLSLVFGVLWFVALLAFIPYVSRIRHPESKPLGAYLSFVTIFSLVAYGIFGGIIAVDSTIWTSLPLESVFAAALVLIVTFVPAFLAGSWMISTKPPRAPSLDGAPPNVKPIGTEPEFSRRGR